MHEVRELHKKERSNGWEWHFLTLQILGDRGVGKSGLYRRFNDERKFDNWNKGDVEFIIQQSFSLKAPSVYILCVAKNDLDSLLNIGGWMEEIRAIAPRTPVLIVLTKADLDASSESEDQQYERHQFEYYKKKR